MNQIISRQMSEGRTRLFIIRNGCAVNAAHADGKWGDVEPLAEGAERNAAAAGMMKNYIGRGTPRSTMFAITTVNTDATSSTWRQDFQPRFKLK